MNDALVRSHMVAATEAHRRLGLALQVMQASAQRGDFERVEEERAEMHVQLDEYVDNFALANRAVRG